MDLAVVTEAFRSAVELAVEEWVSRVVVADLGGLSHTGGTHVVIAPVGIGRRDEVRHDPETSQPFPWKCRYLVTLGGSSSYDSTARADRVLGGIAEWFAAQPIIVAADFIGWPHVQDELGDEALRVTPQTMPFDQEVGVWQTLGLPYQLSLMLIVEEIENSANDVATEVTTTEVSTMIEKALRAAPSIRALIFEPASDGNRGWRRVADVLRSEIGHLVGRVLIIDEISMPNTGDGTLEISVQYHLRSGEQATCGLTIADS